MLFADDSALITQSAEETQRIVDAYTKLCARIDVSRQYTSKRRSH